MEQELFENIKDFDRFINIKIYINGLFLLNSEEDKLFNLKINLSNFADNKKENCGIFKPFLEDKIKKYIVKKIKENDCNIIELSKKHSIPVKNIIYSIFINNRIDNIDVIWSPCAIKEFKYVPIKHYLDYDEDTLFLKVKKFSFKKNF